MRYGDYRSLGHTRWVSFSLACPYWIWILIAVALGIGIGLRLG